MDCRYLDDVYELLLLGTLPDERFLELREHLQRGCEHCLGRAKEAARTVYLLSLTAKPVAPGPKAKADLLRTVKSK